MYYKIPAKFFEAVKQTKDQRLQVLWMRWLAYGSEILNPDILQKLIKEHPSLDAAVVRDIYNFGLPYMQDSLFSSEATNPENNRISQIEKILKERSKESTDTFKRLLEAETEIANLKKRDAVIETMAEKIGFLMDRLSEVPDYEQEPEKPEKGKKKEEDEFDKFQVKEDIVDPVIDYLNKITGSDYRKNSKKTRELIRARIKDGFTLEDFKTVIRKKHLQWKGTDYEKFLRPITLFSVSKFESYLNEPEKAGTGQVGVINSIQNAISQANKYIGMGGNE